MCFASQQENLILSSYMHWMGEVLFAGSSSLFEAPFVLLSHGVEADPILNYGNQQALHLWEMTWDAFTQMPSRLTAEMNLREDRSQLLADVKKQGYSRNYSGVRISKSGRRFQIEKALVWNLIDEKGEYAGQAACFSQWKYLSN